MHELARAGVEVERAPRPVTITHFDVELAGAGERGAILAIDVECSSGTYVRSLAGDLGVLLGGGAHLRGLRRLSVGPFSVEDAVSLGTLEASPRELVQRYVLAPAKALPGMARAVVGAELAGAVAHGKVLAREVLETAGARGAGPWAILAEGGKLLAVYESRGNKEAKPAVVLCP